MDQDRWLSLMELTAQRAAGNVSWAPKVAERAAVAPVRAEGLRILRLLIGGVVKPWERSMVGRTAAESLVANAAASDLATDRERLRDRLLELGFFDALDETGSRLPDPRGPV